MKNKFNKDFIILIAGLSSLILIDRVLKFLVINSGIDYEINTGISFSLLDYSMLPVLVSLGALVAVFLLWRSSENKIPLVIIMAGGMSNLIDRFVYGGVIDYIVIGNLPVFNLADIYINLGLLLFVLIALLQYIMEKKSKKVSSV